MLYVYIAQLANKHTWHSSWIDDLDDVARFPAISVRSCIVVVVAPNYNLQILKSQTVHPIGRPCACDTQVMRIYICRFMC